MKVIRKFLVVLPLALAAAALALVALGVTPAHAATVHPSKYQVRTLNVFLGVLTNEHVSAFSRIAGPSDLLLVRFGVWRTFHANCDAVQFDAESYGYVNSDVIDAVDLRFFGRTVATRSSYPGEDITYVDGDYRFMPATGDPVHRAKLTAVTSSAGRVWTVCLRDLSRPEWAMTGPWTTVGHYVATVRLGGSASKPDYVLIAWKKG